MTTLIFGCYGLGKRKSYSLKAQGTQQFSVYGRFLVIFGWTLLNYLVGHTYLTAQTIDTMHRDQGWRLFHHRSLIVSICIGQVHLVVIA